MGHGGIGAGAPGKGIRILAIDGGGVLGIIPSQVLAGLERAMGRPVASMFDLIVGTSVGALVGLLLTCPHEGTGGPRYAADELTDLFMRNASRMFAPRPVRHRRCPALSLGSVYRTDAMEAVIRDHLGAAAMRSALTRVGALTFDMLSQKLMMLRSEGSGPLDGAVGRMWEAARAATAAPSYFDPVIVRAAMGGAPEACLIDAGVCANSPGLIAFQEAVRLRATLGGAGPVSVLSLGCGVRTANVDAERVARWPRVRWICPLLSMMTGASGALVDGQMGELAAAGLLRYHRVESDLSGTPAAPGSFDDGRKTALRAARDLGLAAFERERAALERFFTE